MELIYYWIDRYKDIITGQGFNFGGELLFDYKKNSRELSVKENDAYIKNFFSLSKEATIDNLTAIVGRNGVGKSTLLEAIKGLLIDGGIFGIGNNENDTIKYYRRLLVFKSSNEYSIIYHTDLLDHEKLTNQFKGSTIAQNYKLNFIPYGSGDNIEKFKNNLYKVKGTEPLNSTSCVFFSTAFDSNTYTESTMVDKKYFDISTKALLHDVETSLQSNIFFSIRKPNHRVQVDTRFNNSTVKEFIIQENIKKLRMLTDSQSNTIISRHISLPKKVTLLVDYVTYSKDRMNFLEIDPSQLLRSEKDKSLL
ncbi:AAA family ATPase, partial [Rossellomorea marisflavi]|uniref:AAA family ATPase n=1 Tax=Rossellomorea marisflavi TaxID=189381 RepID=UPI00064EE0FE